MSEIKLPWPDNETQDGVEIDYDQARALYEGAKMILELLIKKDFPIETFLPEIRDEYYQAIALLKRGIGEDEKACEPKCDPNFNWQVGLCIDGKEHEWIGNQSAKYAKCIKCGEEKK